MHGSKSQISRVVDNSSSGSCLSEHSPGFQNDHSPSWGFFKVTEVPRRTRGHHLSQPLQCCVSTGKRTSSLHSDTTPALVLEAMLFCHGCRRVPLQFISLVDFSLWLSPTTPLSCIVSRYTAPSWLDIGINNKIQFPSPLHLILFTLAVFSSIVALHTQGLVSAIYMNIHLFVSLSVSPASGMQSAYWLDRWVSVLVRHGFQSQLYCLRAEWP